MNWETVALLLGTVVMVLEHLRDGREDHREREAATEQRLVRLEVQVEQLMLERGSPCPDRSGPSQADSGEG